MSDKKNLKFETLLTTGLVKLSEIFRWYDLLWQFLHFSPQHDFTFPLK
jgi:hypothetical protein